MTGVAQTEAARLVCWAPFYPWVTKFLERFGYDKIILAACPAITVVEDARALGEQQRQYIDKANNDNWHLHRRDFKRPKLGRTEVRAWTRRAGEPPA